MCRLITIIFILFTIVVFPANGTPTACDRAFGEDNALMGGLGRFKGASVVVMGQKNKQNPGHSPLLL